MQTHLCWLQAGAGVRSLKLASTSCPEGCGMELRRVYQHIANSSSRSSRGSCTSLHPAVLLAPCPDETPRKRGCCRHRARRLVHRTEQHCSAVGGCAGGSEVSCIVLRQDNQALPQPLSYGNPKRLLSPLPGEARHLGLERLVCWVPVLNGRRAAGAAGAF